MNSLLRPIRLLGSGLFAQWASVAAVADLNLDFEVDIRIGRAVKVAPLNEADYKGPPLWAPAHGLRSKAVYHYYPEYQVYQDTSSGTWFYYRDGQWQAGVNLPLSINIGSSSTFVSLSMETGTPYAYHKQVLKAYPKSHVADVAPHESAASHPGIEAGRKHGSVPPGWAKKGKGRSK